MLGCGGLFPDVFFGWEVCGSRLLFQVRVTSLSCLPAAVRLISCATRVVITPTMHAARRKRACRAKSEPRASRCAVPFFGQPAHALHKPAQLTIPPLLLQWRINADNRYPVDRGTNRHQAPRRASHSHNAVRFGHASHRSLVACTCSCGGCW